MRRYRGARSLWSALPAYLGGKRRLCPMIFRELDRVLPRGQWPGLRFLDGFLGGGAVSLYAKAQGFQVHAIDIADRSIVVGNALIANSRAQLVKADIVRALSRDRSRPGRIETEMVPAVFPVNVARFLDGALAEAASADDPAHAALLRLLVIKVAMLAHPMAQVRPGTAHRMATGEYESITESCVKTYVDAARLTTPARLWRVAEAINAGVFGGTGRVWQGSALDLLDDVEADVAYFDPPYPGTTPYEREYRTLDRILGDERSEISAFSRRGGVGLLDELLDRSRHIPVVLLSCGNAEITLAELEARMQRVGRDVRGLEIPYAHKASVARASVRERNRELLVIGVDPAANPESRATRATRLTAEVLR